MVIFADLVFFNRLPKKNKKEQQTVANITRTPPEPSIPSYIEITPNENATGVKTYINKVVGYTIQVPASWGIEINNDQTLGVNYTFTPPGGFAANNDPHVASMRISYPSTIQGTLQDIEKERYMKYKQYIATDNHTYTTIDGHSALIIPSISYATQVLPTDFRGDTPPPAGAGSKTVIIEMQKNKVINIEMIWGRDSTDNQSLFDKAISTLHFTK